MVYRVWKKIKPQVIEPSEQLLQDKFFKWVYLFIAGVGIDWQNGQVGGIQSSF